MKARVIGAQMIGDEKKRTERIVITFEVDDSFLRGSLIEAYRDNKSIDIVKIVINGVEFT